MIRIDVSTTKQSIGQHHFADVPRVGDHIDIPDGPFWGTYRVLQVSWLATGQSVNLLVEKA